MLFIDNILIFPVLSFNSLCFIVGAALAAMLFASPGLSRSYELIQGTLDNCYDKFLCKNAYVGEDVRYI